MALRLLIICQGAKIVPLLLELNQVTTQLALHVPYCIADWRLRNHNRPLATKRSEEQLSKAILLLSQLIGA